MPDLFLLPLLGRDLKTRGRPHGATIFGGLGTDAWLDLARWAGTLVA